jgi:Tetratricopeptide repeat
MWRVQLAYAAIVTLPFLGMTTARAQTHFQFPTNGLMLPSRPPVVVHPAAPAAPTTHSTSWSYSWHYSWTNPSSPIYVPYPVYSGYSNPYPYNYSPSLNTPGYPVNSYPGAISTNYPTQGGSSAHEFNPQKGFRAPPLAKSKSHVSSTESKAKVDKLIELGDANFGKQQYAAAIGHYKEAARIAPEMAEPFLRQGFALLAQKRYAQAVKAIRSGLEIRSDWTASSWRLDQIYTEGHLEKTNQQVTKFVEANPLDANLAIALGVQLYFTDHQRDRAATYFVRAQQLGANPDHLLDPFLPQPALAEAPTRPLDKPPLDTAK